jgi:hypothetical protein
MLFGISLYSHPIEWVFAGVALPGIFISWLVFRKAMHRLNVININKLNGFLHDGAVQTVTREAFKLFIHGMILVAAVMFLFLPPPGPYFVMPTQSFIGVFIFVLISIAHTISSYSALRSIQKHAKKFDAMFPFKRRFEEIATRDQDPAITAPNQTPNET